MFLPTNIILPIVIYIYIFNELNTTDKIKNYNFVFKKYYNTFQEYLRDQDSSKYMFLNKYYKKVSLG